MNTTQTYNLLTAAVAFREAYLKMCKTYDGVYDADFTEQYPLGQIDIFDKNTRDALTAWLNCHTTKLINSLPDRVINPACIRCLLNRRTEMMKPYIGPKVSPNGCCDIRSSEDCALYPYVVFDAPVIKRFLKAQEYDATIRLEPNIQYDDMALRVLYNKLLNNLHIQDFNAE